MIVRVSGPTGLVISFVSQVIFGCIGFLILYGAAVALSFGIYWLNRMATDSSPWLPVVAPYVEMALFGADLLAFALFVLAKVVSFGRALWQELNQSHDG